MNTGIGIGNFTAGAAKMNLVATVKIYEKGKGIVLASNFSEDSEESFPMVKGMMFSENYKKGFSSANLKILPKIKEYLLMNKTEAAAAAVPQS